MAPRLSTVLALLLLFGGARAFLLLPPAAKPSSITVSTSCPSPTRRAGGAPVIARCGSHLQQRQAWVARLRAASEEADELDHDEEEEEDEDEENEEEEDPLSRSRSSSSLQGQNLTATIPDLLGSRSLGLDWGHKKIGVGLSAGFSQRPLGTIPNAGGINGDATKNRPTLDHILTLVRAEGAVRVVMGNPLFRDGSLSPQANSTKTFARQLANRAVELGMAQPWRGGDGGGATPFVYLWDERLTSQAARVNIKTKAFLHSSNDVDSQAACLVLEDFYQAKAYKAEVVWPEPGVQPPQVQRPPPAASGDAGEDGAEGRPAGPAGGGGGGRTHMSYDEWRRSERERYEASRLNFQQAAEEGAAKKKKKKKKKK